MSEGDEHAPFERRDHIDQPGIVGASWWRDSLANAADPISRRRAINLALGATGTVLGLGAIILLARSCDDDENDDLVVERRKSLDMQRTYGWSFGASTERVTFDGYSTKPFDRALLPRLNSDLRPWSAHASSYFVGNLFEVLGARPRVVADGDPESIVPLEDVLEPIFTQEMGQAYEQGRALGGLIRSAQLNDILVIVDLNGPSSVAFAAGALPALEPIFAFGNWPHPRGVVKSHLTLAAAAYYQPLFVQGSREERPCLLVLDRQRLAPYTEDASQFDNRYQTPLPNAGVLKRWGVRRVLYVTPSPSVNLPWDLDTEVVGYGHQGLEVKLLSADIFSADYGVDGTKSADFYYGGSKLSHGFFWHDYPWLAGKPPVAAAVTVARPGKDYVPPAHSPAETLHTAATVDSLGTMAVAVSRTNGHILGAMMSRSGSWNRSDGAAGG